MEIERERDSIQEIQECSKLEDVKNKTVGVSWEKKKKR